jgi:MFS family permease
MASGRLISSLFLVLSVLVSGGEQYFLDAAKRRLTSSSAYVKSDGEWIARSLVTGFFVAPVEALPEISVTDIYFTHERGTYMGVYSFALAGSNYFAPVICGFIAERQGWQWVFCKCQHSNYR